MTLIRTLPRLAAVIAMLGLAFSSARAGDDIYVHAGPNFTPVTIAVTPLAGDDAGTKLSSIITNATFLKPAEVTDAMMSATRPYGTIFEART